MRKLSVVTLISTVRPVALEAPLEAVEAAAASGSVGSGLQGQLGLQGGAVAVVEVVGEMQLRPARAVKYYPY